MWGGVEWVGESIVFLGYSRTFCTSCGGVDDAVFGYTQAHCARGGGLCGFDTRRFVPGTLWHGGG